MKFLLTIKHWQLFLLFTIYGFWPFQSSIFNSINYLGIALFVLWTFAIGFYGQKQLSQLKLKADNTYGIKSCLIFILITLIATKFYHELPSNLYRIIDQSLPVLIFIAIIAGFIYSFLQPKHLLKSNSKKM